MTAETRLILASTSPFRRELLSRLQLEFAAIAPTASEQTLPEESAETMVQRLALAKAQSVAETLATGLVIGSDQCAVIGNEILGKPGNFENAVAQLRRSSGQAVTFYTGLCLFNASTAEKQIACIPYTVYFRELSDAQITGYLNKEQPFNCAGSFKSEGLGAALFERMQGDDPSALIGLPLICLSQMLENAGFDVLDSKT